MSPTSRTLLLAASPMRTSTRAAPHAQYRGRRSPPRARGAPAHVQTRSMSTQQQPRTPSRHAQFYTDYAAGMIPVALLGSAVYIGLRTWQQYLAHEKFLEEAQARVQQLESEVIALRQQQQQHLSANSSSDSQNTPSETTKRSGWRFW